MGNDDGHRRGASSPGFVTCGLQETLPVGIGASRLREFVYSVRLRSK
jgi:hypothetical protein